MIHSDADVTELTWQVLTEGYLTPLLLVHQLNFRPYIRMMTIYKNLKSLSRTSNVKLSWSQRHGNITKAWEHNTRGHRV